jgi:hypothetical protein
MNLDVVNNSTTEKQPLVFNETRNMPFLKNSQDYFCSVVRFTLQTSNSLPVFIPDILTGQSDFNKTVYAITMSLTKYTRDSQGTITSSDVFGNSRYITYNSLDFTQPEPAPPSTRVDTSSSYYFIYNINDWVDMVNLTFRLLTQEIITSFQEAGKPVSFKPPFITYDITNGLFTIHSDNSVDAVGSSGNFDLKIAFNARLYNILPFSSKLEPFPPIGATIMNTNYILNIFNKSDSNVNTILSSANAYERYITLQTEFSPLPILNPIRNIFFTTTSLPIVPTLVSPPKIIGDTNLSTGSVSGDISNIIVDYSIPVSSQNSYNGEIIYAPQAEYRLLSMKETNNLNKIDLSCFWETKTGITYPIYLPSGCSSNIKLLFRAVNYNIN